MTTPKLSNKKIEKLSIRYVTAYLESLGENPVPQKPNTGADIISEGKHIEVKGCMKRATNLRMSEQMLDSVEKAGKLKQGSFFIYYVYDMATKPKLMIFDYDTYNANKREEKKWIIQPLNLKNNTRKPDSVSLPKLEAREKRIWLKSRRY